MCKVPTRGSTGAELVAEVLAPRDTGLDQAGRAELVLCGTAKGLGRFKSRTLSYSIRWTLVQFEVPASLLDLSGLAGIAFNAASRSAKRCKPNSRHRGWICCWFIPLMLVDSQLILIGTVSISLTSSRVNSTDSRACSRFARRFAPDTSSAWASTLSSVLYRDNSCRAVFGPIKGTPGTLSTASPTSAWKSTTWSALIPHSRASE